MNITAMIFLLIEAPSLETIVRAVLAVVIAVLLFLLGGYTWSRKLNQSDLENDKIDEEDYEAERELTLVKVSSDIEQINTCLQRIEVSLVALTEQAQKNESSIEQLAQQLAGTQKSVKEIAARLKRQSQTPKAEAKGYLKNREHLKQEKEEAEEAEELQKYQQEEQQKQEEIIKNRQALKNDLLDRLKEFTNQSGSFRLSVIINYLIQQLQETSPHSNNFEAVLSPYVETASKAERFKKKLDDFDVTTSSGSENNQNGIETEFLSLKGDFELLEKELRPGSFIDLIEEANRHSSLHKVTEDLKNLLSIEEFDYPTGEELPFEKNLEVVSTEGSGSKPVISEIVETGYRHKDSGTVLKKPKVKVCLED